MSDTPDQSPAVDFDQLLDAVDPGFTKSLEDLNQIQNADVDISGDAALDLDHHPGDDDDELPHAAGHGGRVARVKALVLRALSFTLFALKRAFELLKFVFSAFARASLAQKGLALLMLVIFGITGYLLLANLRGTWLPSLTRPVVGRLAPFADRVDSIEKGEGAELVDLRVAFPPEVHEFLFRRFKVNLKPTAENPQPMGAFEFVVGADTKETAIEARDREVEFADMIERLFEDQTFNDLATEFGKAQLKDKIQGALNEKLSAGRVTAVNFKTFILKP